MEIFLILLIMAFAVYGLIVLIAKVVGNKKAIDLEFEVEEYLNEAKDKLSNNNAAGRASLAGGEAHLLAFLIKVKAKFGALKAKL